MTASPRPRVLGHRGDSAHAPDNTLEAFRLAVAAGADGVELDVRLCADGHPILSHDPRLEGVGVVSERTLAELEVDAPHVPTLEAALGALDGLFVDIELKNSPAEPDHDPEHASARVVIDLVRRLEITDRVAISSFNPLTMDAVRSIAPDLATWQLLGPASPPSTAGRAAAAGHDGVAVAVSALAGDRLRAWRTAASDHGLALVVWTVDEPAELRRLAAGGVDVVIANDPGRAIAVLEGSG